MDTRDRRLACALLRREFHRTGRYHNWRSEPGAEQGEQDQDQEQGQGRVIGSRGEVSVLGTHVETVETGKL